MVRLWDEGILGVEEGEAPARHTLTRQNIGNSFCRAQKFCSTKIIFIEPSFRKYRELITSKPVFWTRKVCVQRHPERIQNHPNGVVCGTPSVPKKRVKSAGQTVHKKIVNLNHIDSYSRNRMNRERGWRIEKEEREIKEKQESPFPPNYLHGGAHT